ncbi:MAG: helix-turn-helix transcriptional regulator [Clostridia bacterium]|nr:helix-turn-helix transcriptional regulator [Clostridia bacterium]
MEKEVFLVQLGKRVRDLRIARGMSQEDLARAVGYTAANSRSTINKVEQGKNDIMRSKLPLYARALGVTVESLMDVNEQPKTEDEILAFTLWGNDPNITAEDIAEVRRFAEFLRQKKGRN